MEIGEAVDVGLVDEDCVGLGDVEAAFDDRRGQEDVGHARHEREHRLLQLRLREPAVHDADRGLGHDLRDAVGHLLDVVDPVVHEKHLPAAGELPFDGISHQSRVPAGHPRFHCDSVGWRRRQIRDVADPEHRHVERPWDRRGRHREHVDARPQGLEPLLHVDAKPLLLVDDHEAEVREVDVGLREPVGADHDVDRLSRQPLERLAFLYEGREPRQATDREGKFRESRRERPPMLFGEYGRGHEHSHLRPRLDCLEGRPHGELGLAVADVSAEQPIHRPGPLHILANRLHRGELIGRLVERKRLFELPLPGCVGREGDAGPTLPHGLQADHVGGHVGHRPLHRELLLFPTRAADLGEFRGELRAAHVFLDEFDAGGRHVDPRALGELDIEELLGPPVLLQELEPLVAADAMRDVNDVIPLVEVEEGVDRTGEPLLRRPMGGLLTAEEFCARHQHELLGHQPEAGREMAPREVQPLRAGRR